MTSLLKRLGDMKLCNEALIVNSDVPVIVSFLCVWLGRVLPQPHG
ncbi:hypothetical protein A2U01_0062993, partial [Trifolium medium]|nr:hypothetical protein [Trifolium medium]